MQLKAQEGSHLVYLGLSQFTPEGKKTLNFVKFGDPVSYENHSFLIQPDKISIQNVTINSPVDVVFEMGVYQGRSTITPVSVTPLKTLQKA